MISKGSELPEANVTARINGEMKTFTTTDLFADKKVVLFAVPGAFTPTCSQAHLPGYVTLADKIKAKGVDTIICLSVNDAFVMEAWGKQHNADEILMLADGDGNFTSAIGMNIDTGTFGGIRSCRYSMLVEDGVIKVANIEEPGTFEVSDAETMLKSL
ncbi:peroxiredoxin [Aliiglaciecola sp. 2_MG-2023]|uniref:peroxiredoxin n=1 Tax=unclassified Aliiglaciecola TaxID=2593648 RepID=UPI0026E22455|nr:MULTISPECIES: peroxiredoxin [unclassified Aliiglaciecola]MDO6712913.1 peroxiredoxin [Aliiglaciecola sp. 2_MG-2023]MDO6752851.1 peroxiredoxin [Aliiglaciecola sp. 1_MG-2023]